MGGSAKSQNAENSSTPVDVLKQLAGDEDWLVREAVAKNSHTPAYIKKQMGPNYALWRPGASDVVQEWSIEQLLKLAGITCAALAGRY